jgi:hypothetical protein
MTLQPERESEYKSEGKLQFAGLSEQWDERLSGSAQKNFSAKRYR